MSKKDKEAMADKPSKYVDGGVQLDEPNREKDFSEAPRKDAKGGTEDKNMQGLKHGRDETGAPAPTQADQVIINDERKLADNSGDFSHRDPRWPAMGSTMRVLPPVDEDSAKQLAKHNEELAKEGEKKQQEQVKSQEKADKKAKEESDKK